MPVLHNPADARGLAGCTHGEATQRSSKEQVELLRLRHCLVRLSVEPAELSEIAADREAFRVFLGMLLPRCSPEEKPSWKWNEKTDRANSQEVKQCIPYLVAPLQQPRTVFPKLVRAVTQGSDYCLITLSISQWSLII